MASKDDSRRKYLELDAVDPVDGTQCVVSVSFDRMHAVARRSMAHAKECGFIVPYILQNPTAVFEGLRLDEDEDRSGYGWRCYCGIPEVAYHPDGAERRAFPGQVFLVFVNDDTIAYNWRWEKADPDDSSRPLNHKSRFKKQLL